MTFYAVVYYLSVFPRSYVFALITLCEFQTNVKKVSVRAVNEFSIVTNQVTARHSMFSYDVDVLMHMHKSRRTLHPRDKKRITACL